MTNEASPESARPVIRPVIRPLSIRPVVHADQHPGSSEVPGHHPSAKSDSAAFCPPRMGRIPLLSLTVQLSARQE